MNKADILVSTPLVHGETNQNKKIRNACGYCRVHASNMLFFGVWNMIKCK